ncbi:histidine kinase, partial [Pseudomonas donghuensis]|nr:histidine kinase [Pseudomonas donghuensis]
HRFDDHRSGPFGPEILINIVLLAGVLTMNIGVRVYFKSEQDRNHLQQLEKERMFLQLQYLKFQINPHFFMNTLNNIQVLIDMDAEKAK